MAKLTKQETKNHEEALEILKKEVLNPQEKEFVLNNYLPAASHNVGKTATFFTSEALACDLYAVTLPEGKILDLCSGIGRLAYTCNPSFKNNEIVCVENNPDFVEIGKKIIPDATWICGNAFDEELVKSLGEFDCVVSNPPFGLNTQEKWLNTRRSHFQAMEIAMMLSDYASFIVPIGLSQYNMETRNHQDSYIHNVLSKEYPNISIYPAPLEQNNDWHLTNIKTEVLILHKNG